MAVKPTALEQDFRLRLRALDTPNILEVGTRRWHDRRTHHMHWKSWAYWMLVDALPGEDVEVVANVEDLAPFADSSFDAVISASLLEHVARPWRAFEAMARVLRPGGLLYANTTQTFPLHFYPDDYFRFSTSALRVLAEDAGLTVLRTEYSCPCQIIPGGDARQLGEWNEGAESFIVVELSAIKEVG